MPFQDGTTRKTVLLIERDLSLQKHFASILNDSPDLQCCWIAPSAREAAKLLLNNRPHIILMDLDLSRISAIHFFPKIRFLFPHARILMLAEAKEKGDLFHALKHGAQGCILKSVRPEELLNAIQDLDSGGSPFSGHIGRKIVDYFQETHRTKSVKNKLSPRECEALELMTQGFSHKEVAKKMVISTETLRTHVKRIRCKLDAPNRVSAIIKYNSQAQFSS